MTIIAVVYRIALHIALLLADHRCTRIIRLADIQCDGMVDISILTYVIVYGLYRILILIIQNLHLIGIHLNLIGDRWTLLILHAVREGRRTYKDLQEGLEGIP